MLRFLTVAIYDTTILRILSHPGIGTDGLPRERWTDLFDDLSARNQSSGLEFLLAPYEILGRRRWEEQHVRTWEETRKSVFAP